MPRYLGPATSRPACLFKIGVSEWETGDQFDVADPDFVDRVALLIEVVRLDTVND